MKNTEGVPYGRGLEVPESSVLSVVLILLAIVNIVTNKSIILNLIYTITSVTVPLPSGEL